jgi:hypothetical protein
VRFQYRSLSLLFAKTALPLGDAELSLLAPFFESLPLKTNKQQEEFSLQKRPVLAFRCVVLIRGVESTKIEVAFSERSTGSDAERGLFATGAYRAPRCRSRR